MRFHPTNRRYANSLAVAALLLLGASGSLRAQERERAPTAEPAAADSIAADSVAADSIPADSIPVDSAAALDGATGADAFPAEPLPAGRRELDETLRAELQAIYDRVPAMDGIRVAVNAGIVRLEGQVPHRQAAEEAAELARAREGVIYVDDDALTSLATESRIEDIGSRLTDQGRAFLRLLPLLAAALVVVVLFGFLAWLTGRFRFSRLFPKLNPFLGAMLQRLAQSLLVVLGLIVALELLDATALVGAVVGTAGLAGLALGFAFKDIAENYLAGVILSLRQPFAKNDLIVVGGHEGKVVRLTGRETILMTPDGNHVQIPNATVFREPMINYTRNPRRRFTVDVDVAAEADLTVALDSGLGVLREMTGVIDDPAPSGLIVGYGNGTMALRFFGWVDQRQAEFGRVRSEAIRLVKDALEAIGVELPSPEYRITMGTDGADESDLPARRRRRDAPLEQRDVSVDRTLDEQIEEERRSDGEENLLE